MLLIRLSCCVLGLGYEGALSLWAFAAAIVDTQILRAELLTKALSDFVTLHWFLCSRLLAWDACYVGHILERLYC